MYRSSIHLLQLKSVSMLKIRKKMMLNYANDNKTMSPYYLSGCLIDNKMRLKFEFYVDSFWALTSARDVV